MPTTLDPETPAGAHALERLTHERIGWLTTIDPDGQPYASAIWFVWQDDEILMYSGKRAMRNANITDNPRVAFNLNTDPGGDDYVSMEGIARFAPDAPVASANPAFLEKYLPMLEGYGWTTAYYDAEYPFAIRVAPKRWRVG